MLDGIETAFKNTWVVHGATGKSVEQLFHGLGAEVLNTGCT